MGFPQSRHAKVRMVGSPDSAAPLLNEVLRVLRSCEEVLAIIGLFCLGKIALSVAWQVGTALRVFVFSRFWRQRDFKEYGKWAVVTGATDGIGKAYARELASRGMNIVLISRTMSKLINSSQEIERDFGVETCIIQADFSKGREIYKDIESKLACKEIGVLVNNVGVLYDQPCLFLDVSKDKLWDIINVNVGAVVMMTHIVMPQMVERKKGIIVNMSSISALFPVPLFTAYAASKMFIDWFSQGLAFEYRNSGIIVQSLVPSYISTNMTRFSDHLQRPSIIVPNANTYCSSAIATLGIASRTTGFWSHEFLAWLYSCTPRWILMRCALNVQSFLSDNSVLHHAKVL